MFDPRWFYDVTSRVHLNESCASELVSGNVCRVELREVTYGFDKTVNEKLNETFADYGIQCVSEENYDRRHVFAEVLNYDSWVCIDPVDGSFNLASGIGSGYICTALMKGITPIASAIWQINAEDGDALLLTDLVPRESAVPVLFSGFPSRSSSEQGTQTIELVRQAERLGYKIRMLGCATESLLNCARNPLAVYYECGIMIWDVAAAIKCCSKAGRRVWIRAVNPNESFAVEVCVAGSKIHGFESLLNMSDLKERHEISCMF